MPEVELCCRCHKQITPDQDQFVVVFREREQTPRRIAHVDCERDNLAEKGREIWSRLSEQYRMRTLERCRTAAQVVDWIIQITHESWADDQTLASLVRALNYALRPRPPSASLDRDRNLTMEEICQRPITARSKQISKIDPDVLTGASKMPEVVLCKYCKQPLNKEIDQYVVLVRETGRYPEVLAHVGCEQKRPGSYGFEEWIRSFRWPGRA